jgi:HlyD family secretion protein
MPEQKSRVRRLAPYLVLGAIALIGVLLRYTWLAPDPIEVRILPVARGRVEATVTNSKAGTVEAGRRSRIASETGGRVVEIRHREGARVEAGEVLVRLAATSERAQLELAEKGVAVARRQLEEACLRRDRTRRELERALRLAEQSIVSEDRLDELQYGADAANVACETARAELERARAQRSATDVELAKTLIRAPFAGVIAEVNVELGEWVTPSPPLLTSPAVIDLIDPTSIYVSAPMDEVDAGVLATGLPVKVTVDSHPGEVFEGRVARVAPYVVDLESQNRTIEIDVEIADPALRRTLLPGTSADVEVILEAREQVLRVPTSALLQGERVLVLEEGRLVAREVELGLRNWQYAEVTSGLAEGDPIVVSLDREEIEAGVRAVAPPARSTVAAPVAVTAPGASEATP